MSSKIKVLENSFLYTFSSLLVKALSFLLLPIYTKFLTPDDYGIISLANGFIQVMIYIVTFSLYSAAVRFYADFKDDGEKVRRLYGTILTFSLISSFIFLCLGIFFQEYISKWFFDGISFYPIVFIALLSMGFLALHNMHQNILQGQQKGKKLVIINISVFIITVLITLFFIGFLKLGAVGSLLAQLIVNMAYTIFMIYDLLKHGQFIFTIDLSLIKEALKYSVPLIPHELSTRVSTFISRVFINQSSSLAIVGLYSVSVQFGGLIDTIQSAVNNAFQPWFFELMNKEDNEKKREAVELSSFLLILYSYIYMGIGLFSQEIIILMTNERYLMSWTAIPILVVGYSVKSIYYFYVNVVLYYKAAARKLFIATITGSIAQIVIASVLIPLFGMYGAALSFVFAKIIVVAIVVIISRQFGSVGYSVTKMIATIFPSLIFMFIGLFLSYTRYIDEFNFINLLYKFLILAIYTIYIFFIKRKMITKVIKSGKLKKIISNKFTKNGK